MNTQLIKIRKESTPSAGELSVINILSKYDIVFEREKYFEDLVNPETNNFLFFDFYLSEANKAIEFDGIHHFTNNDKSILDKQRKFDSLKNEYCFRNNIPLLRISIFTEDLEQAICCFLFGKTVSTENDVPFLRVPKFLREIVTPRGAELYAILKERRRWLIDYQKINNHQSWFYYPTKELQADFLEPNSINYLKLLLNRLENTGLVETKVVKSPFSMKYYRLIDEAYIKLANKEANNWVKTKVEKHIFM